MNSLQTLTELKSLTSAYDGFSVIQDCDIGDYYRDIFPHYCECGAEMIMTEPGHTQLQCCNPGCYIKMGHRLSHFISFLGYKGFGEASGLALLRGCHDKLKFNSFLAAFLLSEHDVLSCLTEYYTSLFFEIRDDIFNRSFAFVDAISALGIQGIGSRSSLFSVVKSPVLLLDYILKHKTDELCDACGIQAPMTRFHLKAATLDICTLMKDVMPNIEDTPKGEVFVAITGKVSVNGKAYTRPEFIALCESIQDANGAQIYKLVETRAENKLQYVIADEYSTSSKYKMGSRLGKLITANEFYNMLLADAGKYATPKINTDEEGQNG